MTAIDLENYTPVSPDEGWIISVSYKLANQGILGSDLFTGFFNANQHYFINLPVQHFLQAITFRLFGAGITQARGVSVVAAVLLIWLISGLTHRWYGAGAAWLASLLLVLWRSDIVDAYPILPLVDVSRSARYDATLVACIWLTIALLDSTLSRPGRLKALLLGACAGLTVLTEFFGLLIVPMVATAWLWIRGRHAIREATSYWVVIGFALIVLPYAIYAAQHVVDMLGQFSLHSFRTQFNSPVFYLDNFGREPDRFVHLQGRPLPALVGPPSLISPFSPWLLIVGIWPALVYWGYRLKYKGTLGDRLLGLSLLTLTLGLALLDVIKLPLYAMILYPSLCVMLAVFWSSIWHWAWRRKLALSLVFSAFSMALLAVIIIDGRRAYRVDLEKAAQVHPYLAVGQKIDSYLEPGARLIGPERWWWALHDHPYQVSLWSIWFLRTPAEDQSSRMVDQFAQARPDYILIDANNRAAPYFPSWMDKQYGWLVTECSTQVADWTDETYGRIEIYRVRKTAAGAPICWL